MVHRYGGIGRHPDFRCLLLPKSKEDTIGILYNLKKMIYKLHLFVSLRLVFIILVIYKDTIEIIGAGS